MGVGKGLGNDRRWGIEQPPYALGCRDVLMRDIAELPSKKMCRYILLYMQHFGHLKRCVDPFLRVVENGHEVWLRRIAKTLPDVKLLDAPLGRSIRKFKRICSNVTTRPSNLLPGALHACKPTVSLIVFVARSFCGILSVVSLD